MAYKFKNRTEPLSKDALPNEVKDAVSDLLEAAAVKGEHLTVSFRHKSLAKGFHAVRNAAELYGLEVEFTFSGRDAVMEDGS